MPGRADDVNNVTSWCTETVLRSPVNDVRTPSGPLLYVDHVILWGIALVMVRGVVVTGSRVGLDIFFIGLTWYEPDQRPPVDADDVDVLAEKKWNFNPLLTSYMPVVKKSV